MRKHTKVKDQEEKEFNSYRFQPTINHSYSDKSSFMERQEEVNKSISSKL